MLDMQGGAGGKGRPRGAGGKGRPRGTGGKGRHAGAGGKGRHAGAGSKGGHAGAGGNGRLNDADDVGNPDYSVPIAEGEAGNIMFGAGGKPTCEDIWNVFILGGRGISHTGGGGIIDKFSYNYILGGNSNYKFCV